jgi:hypothetical protein
MSSSSHAQSTQGTPHRPDISRLYRRTLSYYRSYFGYFMAAAACVLLPFLLVQMFLNLDADTALQQLLGAGTPDALKTAWQRGWPAIVGTCLWSLASQIVVQPLLLGVIGECSRVLWNTGRPLSIRLAFPRALRRLGPAAAASLMVCAAGGAVVVLVLAGLSAVHLPGAAVVSGGAAAVIVCVIAWVYLFLRISQVVPVALFETGAVRRPVVRSWRLTQQSAWYILGFLVLVWLTAGVFQFVLFLIGWVFGSSLIGGLLLVLGMFLTMPFTALARANLYLALTGRGQTLEAGTEP